MKRIASFIAELRRRRVFRAAVAYVVGTWVLVQVATTVFPLFELPDWAARAVLIALLLGFPAAMVLAWAFDLTAHGLRATREAELTPSAAGRTYGSLPLIAVAALLVGSGVGTFFALSSLRPASAAGKSIAVLPFENLSGRPEDAYLADGLQEEILNALARLRDLKVISRTSVMEYLGKAHNIREIGERLGVTTIVEGSVRREENTLRLTVQLIDARDDHHLLAANYDRDLAHVLDLQSKAARLVADALDATLTRYERGELDRVATNSGDAYDRYLRAVALFRQPAPGDPQGLHLPKRFLEEALGFDPDYADAWALLSQVHTWQYFFAQNEPDEGVRARQAFERALAIDPKLPEAQLSRGLYEMYVSKDLNRALADLDAVIGLRPNSAEAHEVLGYALRRLGRMEEALGHLQRAWDLDPLNIAYSGGPITTLLGLRRVPEAIDQTETYSARFPNSPDSYLVRARMKAWLQHDATPFQELLRDHGQLLDAEEHQIVEASLAQVEGRYSDAARIWEGLINEDAAPSEDPVERVQRSLQLGCLYRASGDAPRAEQALRAAEILGLGLLKQQSADVDLLVLVAYAQSLLGEHTAAMETIDHARALAPERGDATNGPVVSFARSVVLVRAGRLDEGYAEAKRLLRVPFGAPLQFFDAASPIFLALNDDPHYEELINHPPRL